MNKSKKLDFFSANYMRDFHCIGQACGEGNCCHGWQITIDESSFKKFKKIMEKTSEGREIFKGRIKKNRSNIKGEQSFASFVMNQKTGYCQFFDEQGLCEIHGNYGEEYLCNTCRAYPRKLNLFLDRQEYSGVLSCPEVARLCLLQKDSTDMQSADLQSFDLNGLYDSNTTKNPHSAYASYIHDIRNILNQFLSISDLPLSSRLFFICYLANRTAPFFNSGGQFTEEQLGIEVDRITTPEILGELHQGYQGLETDLQVPLQLIDAILTSKGQGSLPPALFQSVIETYGLAEIGQDSNSDNDISKILSLYALRRNKLQQRFNEKLDLVFTNFCKHHISSCPYTESTNLLLAMQALLARTTTAAFFLYSHTRLDPLIAEGAPGVTQEEAEKILDDVIVEVFYRFSRTLEHDKNIWDKVFCDTDKANLATFALLTQLLKFMD